MPARTTERLYVTPPEFAAEVGVMPETVISWIRSGELPAVNLARRGARVPRFKIQRCEIENFLRRRSVYAPSKATRRRSRPELPPVPEYV